MHDECGVLVQGFDSPPVVMMPYNPAHYPALIEACGYCKERDLIAYEFITNQAMRPAIVRISETIEASGAFRVREIETKRFQREVETVRRIYNSAWDDNWGFVPLEDDEFRWRAASLKSILDPRLACFVEARGDDSWNAVGFVLAIPDVNEILIHLRGRLTPLAIARLVFGLRRVKTARVIMLGVVREYRKRGLESLLLREVHQRAARAGIRRGELSWVLEDNHATNRTIVKAGGRAYKVYSIYRKSIV
ncbi:MAG: GNAT family N-acetyltransferase [Planctomycetes bacterium]|nr:GNAT family N-acetyltransferase [Planctomycetota bacterium]